MKYNAYQYVRVTILKEKLHSKLTKCGAFAEEESDYYEMQPKHCQNSKVVDNLTKIHQHVFKHKKMSVFFLRKLKY